MVTAGCRSLSHRGFHSLSMSALFEFKPTSYCIPWLYCITDPAVFVNLYYWQYFRANVVRLLDHWVCDSWPKLCCELHLNWDSLKGVFAPRCICTKVYLQPVVLAPKCICSQLYLHCSRVIGSALGTIRPEGWGTGPWKCPTLGWVHNNPGTSLGVCTLHI